MSASDIGAAAVGNDYYANPDKYDVSKYYNTKNTYLAIYPVSYTHLTLPTIA